MARRIGDKKGKGKREKRQGKRGKDQVSPYRRWLENDQSRFRMRDSGCEIHDE
jgi:hypothetical protein